MAGLTDYYKKQFNIVEGEKGTSGWGQAQAGSAPGERTYYNSRTGQFITTGGPDKPSQVSQPWYSNYSAAQEVVNNNPGVSMIGDGNGGFNFTGIMTPPTPPEPEAQYPYYDPISGKTQVYNTATGKWEIDGVALTAPNSVTPSTPSTPNGSLVTSQDIYKQKMTLAEQLAAEQRRIAETTAQYQRQSLADQLDAQRRQYAQQLAAMNEQMYGQGNRLLEGLANRGLATSGLLQLGGVQSQMAKGQGLSELAYQDRIGREGIGEAQRQVEGNLLGNLRQSALDKMTAETGALEQLYDMQQSEQAQSQQQAYNMLSMITEAYTMLNDPNTSQEIKNTLIPLLQAASLGDVSALESFIKETPDTDGGSGFSGLVSAPVTGATKTLGTSKLNEVGWTSEKSLNTSGVLRLTSGSMTTNFDIKQFMSTKTEAGLGTVYYFETQEQADAFNNYLKEQFKGLGTDEEWEDITVRAVRANYIGKTHATGDMLHNRPFVTTDGKSHKTWNQALEHQRELNNS